MCSVHGVVVGGRTGRATDERCGKGFAGRGPRWVTQDPLQSDVGQQWSRGASGAQMPEPDGTAVSEARAEGTPVVAMAREYRPSRLKDGGTGFLSDDQPDFTRAPRAARSLPPRPAPRPTVADSPAVMAQHYERIFNDVISQSAEAAGAARQDGQPVEQLS